jgi:predicted SnoaL-like aldol condensation-catalyzing enzyme
MTQAPYVPRAQEARNKAVVERYFHEVLDRKRFDLMPEIIARDAVLHRPGFDVNGLDAAVQRLRAVLNDYTAFSTELSGLMAEGDMVCVRVRHRTRTRAGSTFRSRAGEVPVATEQDLEWSAIVQFRLEDGKIAEEWVMRDELGMLAQLGKITAGG